MKEERKRVRIGEVCCCGGNFDGRRRVELWIRGYGLRQLGGVILIRVSLPQPHLSPFGF